MLFCSNSRGTGETTEWEDILVKKGILPPRETKEQNIEEDTDEPAPGHPLENATLTEMDEFEVCCQMLTWPEALRVYFFMPLIGTDYLHVTNKLR